MHVLWKHSIAPAKPWFRRSVAITLLLVACLAGPWLLASVLAAPGLAAGQADEANGNGQPTTLYLPIVLRGPAAVGPTPELADSAVACLPTAGNLLANPSFEQGSASWTFYTSGTGAFTTGAPAADCSLAARLAFTKVGTNMQLYQPGRTLKPNTRYRLSFSAYSTTGRDLKVFLQKHTSPYTSYGLDGPRFDLSTAWRSYSFEFTSSGLTTQVSDGRLRFAFAGLAQAGDVYWLDNIVLVEASGGPTATSTPTRTPSPNATATGTAGTSKELLVFDWNKPVLQVHRGFPRDYPPRASANGNWTTPVNFAQGTLYYRVQIRSQPVAQNMSLQFCFWQYSYAREECGPRRQVWGRPGTVVTWSVPVQQMYQIKGPINWAAPRQVNGVAVKTSGGLPVSNYNGWNWNGQNPAKWYPLDMRFTVVVVAKGSTFSGWNKWTGAPADGGE